MTKINPQIPLVLFAKAPIAGQVKTRLTSHCSPQQAAEIAKILLTESLTKATTYWPGEVYLSIWQYNQHPFIMSLLEQFGIELLSQTEGDLGEKMLSTFDQLARPAAIMGCDAPLVTEQALKQAYTLLAEGQNVIGPSEDGGYYLIGLTKPILPLFKGISWGQDSVLADTMKVACENTIDLIELPKSYDIDHWDDVLRASNEIAALRTYTKSIR